MIFKAKVVNVADPYQRGRIQIEPLDYDQNVSKDKLRWAEACSPYGGGNKFDGAGFFFLPEIGSQIWYTYEAGDKNRLIWLGSSFFEDNNSNKKNKNSRNQAIPLAAKQNNSAGRLKVLQSSGGNRLILDDRDPQTDTNGVAKTGIRLLTSEGDGLNLSNKESIQLGFGTKPGVLKFSDKGLKLHSNKRAGLEVYDSSKQVILRGHDDDAYIGIKRGDVVFKSQSFSLLSPSKISIQSSKGLDLISESGSGTLSAGNLKIASGQDLKLSASGGSLNVNAGRINFTTTSPGNFELDIPLPSTDNGEKSGSIYLNTTAGSVVLRNGILTSLAGEPKYTTSQSTNHDLAMGLGFINRLVMGNEGNTLLEGLKGGIFISGDPISTKGDAGGLGGRIPIAKGLINPSDRPGKGPQPVVLGGNLYHFLVDMLTALDAFITDFTTTVAPSLTVGPPTPHALSPAGIKTFTELKIKLQLAKTLYIDGGTPTSINSALVFVDG